MVVAANSQVFVEKVFVTAARASEDLMQWSGHPGTDYLAASLVEWQCRSADRLYSLVQVVDRIDHRKAYDRTYPFMS